MIYATDLCDSGCKHCLIWAKRPVKHLPFEKIKEIMSSKCVTKNTVIGLEGGEFLLHPQALEIMEWLTENHPNFDLLSNCLKPDSLIEAVKKYPPKRLYLSLDGTKDTYLYMRGKDGYDSVLKVIDALKDVVPISAMFTLSPYNDFSDMQHVAEVCKKYGIDLRIGVYNDIDFFDTVDKAHETSIGERKDSSKLTFKEAKTAIEQREQEVEVLEKENPDFGQEPSLDFKQRIPEIVKDFQENYDFLVLYDEWRAGNLKMKCHSILDSLTVLPNGDVPICQNLGLKLGNVNNNTLDEVFNGTESQKVQHDHVHNCNKCWINFHRKYDVVLYRTFEKYFGKGMTHKLFGYYQWEASAKKSYSQIFKEV